jgi:hypothetical protein
LLAVYLRAPTLEKIRALLPAGLKRAAPEAQDDGVVVELWV